MSNLGRRGEVWFAEIKGKRRPVLIVSGHDVVVELDRVIANITSQQTRNKYDVVLEYWKEAGLDKPSVVRCSKINTIHYRELLFKIGNIHEHDLKRVMETIRNYFSY
ncbi:PemK-like protein [Anoxybacillus ayderensis]|uniref:PemK-like protein n=1 Tax=Anoxybacillus ayderensis TaxID=265546 RepID=A0A0D0HSQ6_9BACL|nr:type II toxin-antitoxin system PemK/MazF family toxin [Anoxybacillus ayderensis]KIP22277.1 PemK-like protein [Anoxybacillus ayderensis]